MEDFFFKFEIKVFGIINLFAIIPQNQVEKKNINLL
jgi:hypothetical protein